MKKLSLLMALVAFGSVGCGKPIAGKITLNGNNQSIPVATTAGSSFALSSGDATLQFKHSLAPKLVITQANQSAEVRLPRKFVAKDTSHFYIKGEKIGQIVDLEGTTRFDEIGSRKEVGSESCYAPGFCYGPCGSGYSCGGYYPGPNPYPGYPNYPRPGSGYGYRTDCPGVMSVERTYETSREMFTVNFRNSNKADDILGMFEGERGIAEHLVDSKPLSACRVL